MGLPFKVVGEDGSPYGGKDFLFWNPPMIDVVRGSRRSTNSEAALIFGELLRRHVRTLAFVRTRRLAELLYVYVRDQLQAYHPDIARRVAPYRASYLPEDRRRIERDLFEGRLLGLATTNAMGLGIDIGDLDATVLTGSPGSVASMWQRAGRSGERSLSVFVAQDNPLDQYLMNHPDAFFGKPHEVARISPANLYILKSHLLCAAYEAPLAVGDEELFGGALPQYAQELVEDELLHTRLGRWHPAPHVNRPAQDVNIRSTSANFYTLVETASGVILQTVEEMTAFLQLHPGAIYLHWGEPYLVTDLDLESRTAYAAKADVPYYTEIRDYTETRVLNVFKNKRAAGTVVYLGEVRISTHVAGFTRGAHFTQEELGHEHINVPPQINDTIALRFNIPDDTLDDIYGEGVDLAGGLHAVEHAAIGMLPLFAMCDRNDIGRISTPLHPDTGMPQVFIHDGHPGGVGISEHGYEVIEQLWHTTLDVISKCPCESGCPSCIQSPKCGNNNQPLDKGMAKRLLRGILQEA